MPNHCNFDHDESTYRTGSTQPPKNYGSIIAALLVLVIALCGIISMLSIANIRLTREVQAAEQQSLSIIHSHADNKSASTIDRAGADNSMAFPIGITGESVSTLYQLYYGLPGGILVSSSRHAAVATGDILLQIDGVRISDADTLNEQLSSHSSGDSVQAVFYRSGKEFTATLIIEEMAD